MKTIDVVNNSNFELLRHWYTWYTENVHKGAYKSCKRIISSHSMLKICLQVNLHPVQLEFHYLQKNGECNFLIPPPLKQSTVNINKCYLMSWKPYS